MRILFANIYCVLCLLKFPAVRNAIIDLIETKTANKRRLPAIVISAIHTIFETLGNWSVAENVFLPRVDAGADVKMRRLSPGQTEIDDNPRVAKKGFLHARSAGLTILTTLKRN